MFSAKKNIVIGGICTAVVLLITACQQVQFAKQHDLYHRHDEYKPIDPIVPKDTGYDHAVEREGWALVWHDEFSGHVLDTTAWTYEVNGDGGGNNELQFYTEFRTNSWVKNGFFNMKAIEEGFKGMTYTSARVITRHKKDFKYGRFDIRAKTPTQQGVWPAIWMLPTNEEYGGWPQSGEIDIMESVGHHEKTVHGTLHYGPRWPDNKHTGNKIELDNDLETEFHVYSVEWEDGEIRWYVDDVLFSTKTKEDLAPYPWPFDKEFFIILNLAIGGDWPGAPDESTNFPKYMFVDYVRVYEKK